MGRVDRRALFTSGAAAALLAATGVSLSAAPEKGGVLRLAVPRNDHFDLAVNGALFDTLTEIDASGALVPDLAVSWDARDDGREWRFKLRPDVRFHSGEALAASDVVASVRDGIVLGPHDRWTVAADTDDLVVFRFHEPNRNLPIVLADPLHVIRPASGIEAVGTGLYHALDYRAGRHLVSARGGPHHKQDRAGWVVRFEVIAIPDAAVRSEALRDGHVDIAALPLLDGLDDTAGLTLLPKGQEANLAARLGVGIPSKLGVRAALDDGRLAQRWWIQAA